MILSPRRTFAILALALVIAPLAARAPLFDPDEGLHAAIAQEMTRTGDYVTPRFLGEPFLDKPILFFWAEALSLRVLGMNEAAVRIPPLLFGVLGMIAVALLGRAMFGETAGVIAGIVYGTMLLPLGVSQVAVHDVAVVPFLCAAVWCLLTVSSNSALGRRIAAVVAAGSRSGRGWLVDSCSSAPVNRSSSPTRFRSFRQSPCSLAMRSRRRSTVRPE